MRGLVNEPESWTWHGTEAGRDGILPKLQASILSGAHHGDDLQMEGKQDNSIQVALMDQSASFITM
jgi:hypothetical protein